MLPIRYDVLHLLTSIPPRPPSEKSASPHSPAGWSDLPSDVEDTFFFSGDEEETYIRAKKRRKVENGREERLRALEQAGEPEKPLSEVVNSVTAWGDSDEEVNGPIVVLAAGLPGLRFTVSRSRLSRSFSS